jgi:GT2 family glycosyltransferase
MTPRQRGIDISVAKRHLPITEHGMPSIDVAIPNYQYGRYLRRCVSSVLSQGLQDIRLLIIDNASTDDSVAIARDLASRDKRIQVALHPSNLGLLSSFNEAIDWASSKYFMLLCADDLLAPGSLARAMALMEEKPEVVLALGDVVSFNSDEWPPVLGETRHAVPWQVSTGWQFIHDRCRDPFQPIWPTFALVRTSIQKEVGYFRSSAGYNPDYEMALRIATRGSVGKTRAIQGFCCKHEASRSTDPNALSVQQIAAEGHESFFSNEGRSIPQAASLCRLSRRTIAGRSYWSAVAKLLRGNLKASANLFKLSFSLSPWTAIIPPLFYLWREPDFLARAAKIIMSDR